MIIDLYEFDGEDTVVFTERLTLRLMKEEDAADIFEIRGDWDTAGDAGIPCMKSLDEARDYIHRWAEDSVVIVLGDKVIGLIESYTDDELPYWSTFLGYYMKKSYRNKGYMTEALSALRNRWTKEGWEIPMLWIFPGNVASERVAAKCGWTSLGCYLMDINGYNSEVEFYG